MGFGFGILGFRILGFNTLPTNALHVAGLRPKSLTEAVSGGTAGAA